METNDTIYDRFDTMPSQTTPPFRPSGGTQYLFVADDDIFLVYCYFLSVTLILLFVFASIESFVLHSAVISRVLTRSEYVGCVYYFCMSVFVV